MRTDENLKKTLKLNRGELSNCPPVLFLIFNRPDLVAKSLESLRCVKPKLLFVAGDGPRTHHPDEDRLCDEARRVIDGVDWPCEILTRFQDHNLGCRHAVSSSINWFFDHVNAGIILEDDCIADPSFYGFCASCLEKYNDNPEVLCITGHNPLPVRRIKESYYFSRFTQSWGWATWRRGWNRFNPTHECLDSLVNSQFMERTFGSVASAKWHENFRDALDGRIDSWAYLWLMSCWESRTLSIVPNVNTISNIGFDARATHTQADSDPAAGRVNAAIKFPLVHPTAIRVDRRADDQINRQIYRLAPIPAWRLLARRLVGPMKRFMLSR